VRESVLKPRLIPILLLRERGLVKTVRFAKPQYLGDPLNALKIFNEKEVDELILLDIDRSKSGTEPDYAFLKEIASECFMPIAYGGGIANLETIRKLLRLGIEKVSINSCLAANPGFIREASREFGNSTIVVSMDVKRSGLFQRSAVHFNRSPQAQVPKDPKAFAQWAQAEGAGEIVVTSIANEGAMGGLDLSLVELVAKSVTIPVIAHGGVGSLADVKAGVAAGATAVAAGSFCVYHGPRKAVLISYPARKDLDQL